MAPPFGMLACWDLEESTGDRIDYVAGLALHPASPIASVPGKVGNCAALTGGTTSYLYGGNILQHLEMNSFTIAFWVRIPALPSSTVYVAVSNGLDYNTNNFRYIVEIGTDGLVRLYIHATSQAQLVSVTSLRLNTWELVTVWQVKTGTSTQMSLQINQDAIATGSGTIPFQLNGFGGFFCLGALSGSGGAEDRTLNGNLDSVMVWSRVLTTEERAEVWNGGAGITCGPPPDTEPPTAPGTLVATAVSHSQVDLSWTASTDNVGVTYYYVERCEGAGCTDFTQRGTAPGTATTYSDTFLDPLTTYSYRVQATDEKGNLSAYSNEASATTSEGPPPEPNLLEGLVACWDLDEASGDRIDHVGGLVLHPYAPIPAVLGHIGDAAAFAHAPEHVLDGGDILTNLEMHDFTIALWVRLRSLPTGSDPSTFYTLVANGESSGYGDFHFWLCVGTDEFQGQVFLQVTYYPYEFAYSAFSARALVVGEWTLVTAWQTVDPELVVGFGGGLYHRTHMGIQFNQEAIGTGDGYVYSEPAPRVPHFTLGAVGGFAPTGTAPLDGDLDTVMIWNRVLSADERVFNWNDGAGYDCTLGSVEPPLPVCPQQLEGIIADCEFTPYIRYGCKLKLRFQTFVTRMRAGHEERIGEWQDPLWVFDITPALRDQADLDGLLAFFRARNGPETIFKFENPLDYTIDRQFFAFGDGVTKDFQMVKSYTSGIPGDTQSYTRPIVLPKEGAQIYEGGLYYGDMTLVPPTAYCYSTLGGIVSFVTAPATGSLFYWSGQFFVPVRFLTNRVYSVIEHYEQFEDQIMLIEERTHVLTSALLGETGSPDFVETRFPERYAQRASIGPEVDVLVVASDSGWTFRQPQWQHHKIHFTVEETEQSQETVQSLMAFFLARKGRLYGFRARDISDFSFDEGGCVVEPTDGERADFQLAKRYDSLGFTQVRPIFKPNDDVVILLDDVPVEYAQVNTTTGMVTFIGPSPPAGAVITATGTFDVPVRFDDDEMTLSIQGFEAYNMEAIGLVEIEAGRPTFTIDSPAPALRTSRAGPAPALFAGQQNCQLPPRPAVAAYLEFRGGTTPSGAGAYSGLQVDHPGSMYKLLAGATSLTFAILVSHVKSGTPSGAVGAVYPMALFSHVMPGMGTDPSLYAPTGFTLYLDNFGAGIALDVSLGAYLYGTSGALCVPQLTLTPRLPAQGAQTSSLIADNDAMHAYVVTMDWVSRQAYWSGTIYGRQEFPVEAFAYATCFAGVGGADARLMEHTAAKYIGALDPAIGQGETTNDAWLGVVSQTPHSPAFHSPLSAFVYEQLMLPTFVRVDMQRIIRDVHTPILKYWGSKYGTGFANMQAPVAPGFDLLWWRADENVQVADSSSGAIQAWGPVACGFPWMKANSAAVQDDGQPRRQTITTMPVLSDVLMLADGRRLLARQT